MNFMHNLERKYGKYAIVGLTKFFVYIELVGYVFEFLESVMGERMGISITGMLCFNMYAILHGQVWRLVSWVFCSSGAASIWNVIFLLCLLSMGNTLESIIGTFQMNFYLFGGVIITLFGGIAVYFIGYPYFSELDAMSLAAGSGFALPFLSMYYITLSIFMALALCMPDGTVNLYFILPIKMKWILILYFVDLGYELFTYFRNFGLYGGLGFGCQIIFALLNLGLFFWLTRVHVNHRQRKRNRQFRAQFSQPRAGSGIYKHKCAICGRTELDDPSLTFRYCSKCAGRYEYCQEHLFTHEHIRPM